MATAKTRKYNKEYYARNKDKRAGHSRKYYLANKEKVNARRLAFQAANPGKQKEYNIRRNYGISVQEYEKKLEDQNSLCAICEIDITSGKQNLDHCHKTGKLRDFLCQTCNQGIGLFKENKELMIKATKYLEKHENQFSKTEGSPIPAMGTGPDFKHISELS